MGRDGGGDDMAMTMTMTKRSMGHAGADRSGAWRWNDRLGPTRLDVSGGG